jgi:hypothetical protein
MLEVPIYNRCTHLNVGESCKTHEFNKIYKSIMSWNLKKNSLAVNCEMIIVKTVD